MLALASELLGDCWPVWLLLPVPLVLLNGLLHVDGPGCVEHTREDVPVPCNWWSAAGQHNSRRDDLLRSRAAVPLYQQIGWWHSCDYGEQSL